MTASMHESTVRSATVRAGGLALIVGAIAFMAVFSYLAATFNYPDVLDGSAATVLPALLATGARGRAVWALYAFLPLLFVPAGVGAFQALRQHAEGSMRLAMHFASIAAVSMMAGLMRWPSIHWELAKAYASAAPGQRPLFDAIFLGLNRYLGNYTGEFLGELTLSLFFLFSAMAMLRAGQRWVGSLGVLTADFGMIGMFRNVTDIVAPAAEINNYLLPIWMIVFGVALLRRNCRPLRGLTSDARIVSPG
jgi:Domain of unknown function (DUF4386)